MGGDGLWGLTLKQPWASAVAYGGKRVENRRWQPDFPPPMWVAIHAGRDDLARRDPAAWRAIVARLEDAWPGAGAARYPLGAVVAVGRMVEVISADEAFEHPDPGVHEWVAGPMCWVLEGVLALPRPVPARGHVGLWPVLGPTLMRVREEYARAKREQAEQLELRLVAS